ncbi:hypothetical protein JOE11_003113 [Robbsia andropogonis]
MPDRLRSAPTRSLIWLLGRAQLLRQSRSSAVHLAQVDSTR